MMNFKKIQHAKNLRFLSMRKKSISIILITIFALCSAAFAVTTAYVPRIAQLDFTMISQDPDPVEPGNIVDLRWKIENIGGGAAEDVQVELVADYPFSLYSGDLVKELGIIQGRQTGDKGVIILYKVRVDENAVEGTNEIKLKYKTANTGWVELDPFEIRIQTVDATLSVEKIDVTPELAAPGEKAVISVEVKNLADSLLKDITVKLDLSSKDLPFAPLQSATEKRIKLMSSGEKKSLDYVVIVEPDAEIDVYKIPLEISFNDNLGNSYEKSDIIGIIVGSAPDLIYNIDSSTIKTAGVKGKVTLKFVNKGLTDIKFLNIKLKETDNYKLLSPEEYYIGNIDSDDYETADFDLYVNSEAPSEINLPLEMSYKDANNRDYKKDVKVVMKIYGAEEAVELGIKEKTNKLGILIAVGIVLVGIIIYVIIKKRRKKK